MGIVYLLHFESKLHHAQHYLGYTSDLDQRLQQHRLGRSGAGLVRAFFEREITFVLAHTWVGSRALERHFKQHWHAGPRLCPLCNGGRKRGRTVVARLKEEA
jgi:predicted GIY-YIG superfamily endonuclease